MIKAAGFERCEVDRSCFRPGGEFTRRDDGVGVAHVGRADAASRGVHFRTADFILLRRAGRDRDVEDLLGIQALLFREVGLHDGALHSDRALRRRDVGKDFGVEEFGVTHPGGAAARELRQGSRFLHDALDQFARFFDDREVGGEVRVEHVVGAERAQKGHHAAFDESAVRESEGFAESHAHGGGGRENDRDFRIGKGGFHGRDFALFDDRVHGTHVRALTAVDADRAVAGLREVVAPLHADVVAADGLAEAAENALFFNALDREIVGVDRYAPIRVQMFRQRRVSSNRCGYSRCPHCREYCRKRKADFSRKPSRKSFAKNS